MVQKLKSKFGTVTIESDSDNNNKAAPKDSWPNALQLRNGTLTQQTNLISVVCHEAIHIIKKTLVTKHAWPELHQSTHYKWEVLLEAVKVLHAKNTDDNKGKQDAQYDALNAQLLNDEKFVRYISKWVCDLLVTSQLDALTFDIGCWSSITSLWTDPKHCLRPDHDFPAGHQWWMFTMCMYILSLGHR